MMTTGKHRRLWRVGVPAALAAAAATVLVVMYLGRGPAIPAIRSAKKPSAEGRKTNIICQAIFYRCRLQMKPPFLIAGWVQEIVPMEKVPRATVEFAQAMIEERAGGRDKNWGSPVLSIEPISDNGGAYHDEVMELAVAIENPPPNVPRHTVIADGVAALLVSSDGRILYEWNPRYWGLPLSSQCSSKRMADGLHILIHDAGLLDSNTGQWLLGEPKRTEYLYKRDERKLVKLRDLPAESTSAPINEGFSGE